MKTRFKHVTVNPDRHGKLRARFRKGGQQIYMKNLPDQPGFKREYENLLKGIAEQQEVSRTIPGSVSDLIDRYYLSGDFKTNAGELSKSQRRGRFESFRAAYGNDLIKNFRFEHIEAVLLDRREKRPDAKGRMVGGEVAANKLRKDLNRLFAYAKKLRWISQNPVEDAEKIGRTKIKGFHTWTEAEIKQYQAHHAIGTKARLALEIILWTGQRRGDALSFGPKHIVDGKVNYTAGKTGADLWLPIPRDLANALACTPGLGDETFLITEYGKPFATFGFGNKFRDWCDQAGLPQCSAHGLRKAITRRMAQMRMTDEEMMAVGGWKQAAMLRVYTEAVDQEELADQAIRVIDSKYTTENGA